ITLVLATVAIPLLLLSWVSVSKMLRKYDSDREESQERIMVSEKRFRDLTENTSDWIWETNCQLQYIYTNPVVKDILGYSADEVLGKTIYDYTPEDEIPRLRAFALELKKNPKPFYNFENRNLHKNGSIRILETSGIPVYNNTGQIIGYRGIDRDITDRKEAEKALWQEKNLLNRITETSPIGITVMDKNGVIIYANHDAVSILGLSKEKITHLSFNSLEWHITDFHGERILDDRMPFHLVRDTKKSVLNFRHAMEKPDGEKIFLSANAAPLLDADGNFEGMVSAIEDITDQVNAEIEMQRLINELQKALADVRTLSGLLPICASCKKVRDDKGYWSSVEKYIQKRSSVKFSHGYCPDCYNKYCSEHFPQEGNLPPENDNVKEI
ncbi:MAG: PAS domain-containing protein, partial [Victivallales bacterium]